MGLARGLNLNQNSRTYQTREFSFHFLLVWMDQHHRNVREMQYLIGHASH